VFIPLTRVVINGLQNVWLRIIIIGSFFGGYNGQQSLTVDVTSWNFWHPVPSSAKQTTSPLVSRCFTHHNPW
jgi:hypothetical protein